MTDTEPTGTRQVRLMQVARSGNSGSSGGVGAWARTHQREAAGGAAGLLVVVLAMRAKRSSSTTAAAGANAAAAADGNAYTAGLSGTPNTQSSDIENYVQDALNQQTQAVNAALGLANAPAAPAVPTAAARAGQYTVVAGDTISGIAMKEYGQAPGSLTAAIRRANPVLIAFPDKGDLGVFVGHFINLPGWTPSTATPKPRPRPKPKPKPKTKPKPVKKPPAHKKKRRK